MCGHYAFSPERLWSEAGERIGLRDILIGTETEVVERSASRALERGDIAYGQVWNLQTLCILGCMAPIRIPPSYKSTVVGLRKKLRKKIAKQNRDLTPDDLVRSADAIRHGCTQILWNFTPTTVCHCLAI
jgi:hypothetical protein